MREDTVNSVKEELYSPTGPNEVELSVENLQAILPKLFCPVIRASFTGEDNPQVTG